MTTAVASSPIRVLVVDDSAFMRMAISRMIASDPELRVVGTAAGGIEALAMIPGIDPNVITLDVQMPGIDGLETLRRIMTHFPRPVIMVSAVTEDGATATFDALALGAFDYVPKRLSAGSLNIHHIQQDLTTKIKAAAQSRRARGHLDDGKKAPSTAQRHAHFVSHPNPAIIAIGASTGGPKALEEILPVLPRELPVPILIVQHMPVGFTTPFAERLDKLCKISVQEAIDSEPLRAGMVYIAPAGFHMRIQRSVDARTVISLSDKNEDRPHVPSVDIMMQSVALAFGSESMGIIMTGMGTDGAQGMNAIHRAGGFTVGQDEPTCTVYGMPRACAELGILDRTVPLAQIPLEILEATRYREPVRTTKVERTTHATLP